MKKLIPIILIIFTAVYSLQAKDLEKRTIEVSSFNKLHLGAAFNVYITQGKDCQMVIEGRGKDLDLVKVKESANSLSVNMRNGSYNTKKINIYLQLKDVNEIEVSGACSVYSKNAIKASALKMRLSGASNLKLELNAESLDLRSSGASNAMLVGNAENFSVNLSGASNVKAKDLITGQVKVAMSGASNLKIHAKDAIEGNCSGAASVKFTGDPQRVLVNTSGAGSVQRL